MIKMELPKRKKVTKSKRGSTVKLIREKDILSKKDNAFIKFNMFATILFILMCIVGVPLAIKHPVIAVIIRLCIMLYLVTAAVLLIWIKDYFYKAEFKQWKLHKKIAIWVWIVFLMTLLVYLFNLTF
ncbi:hypothetical protein O0Q50_20550 [Priestia aryabhattai]|uniref:Uncharacterized protein n=1 Tax=Priestia aryabhattai TaxID=412384 RepID=A0AAX6ND28_PRIAR|nr:hypothetical protein [Priestia aryabhattai]MDU9693570.1 hypothetical protein [Priestia aryabhattai]